MILREDVISLLPNSDLPQVTHVCSQQWDSSLPTQLLHVAHVLYSSNHVTTSLGALLPSRSAHLLLSKTFYSLPGTSPAAISLLNVLSYHPAAPSISETFHNKI